MAIPGAELEVRIEPNDAGLQDAMERWARELQDAKGEIKDIAKQTKKAAEAADKVGMSWDRVAVGLNQGLELVSKFAGAARAVGDFVAEQAQLQAQQENFARTIGDSARAITAFRGAVEGTVTDDELRRFGVLASNAGLARDQIASVLQVATRLSAAGFGATSEVAENLIDGIVGASDSVYEAYGIVVDLGAETEKWAAKNGIAKDAIDKTIQSQAALEVVTGRLAQKFADVKLDESVILQTQRLAVEVSNVQARWSATTAEIGVGLMRMVGLVSESQGQIFAQQHDRVTEMMDRLRETQALVADDAAVREYVRNVGDVGRVFDNVRVQQRDLRAEIGASTEAMAAYMGMVEREARARADAIPGITDEVTKLQLLDAAKQALHEQYGTSRVLLDREYEARRRNAEALREEARAAASLLEEQYRLARQTVQRLTAPQSKDELDAMRAERPPVLPTFEPIGRKKGGGGGGGRNAAAEYGAAQNAAGLEALRALRLEMAEAARASTEAQLAEDQTVFGQLGVFGDTEAAAIDAARTSVDGLAESFRSLGGAYQDGWVSRIQEGGIILSDEVSRLVDLAAQAEKAGLSTAQAAAAAVPGAIAAAAGITKALGGSIQVQEVLYGLADAAMAATKFAAYDYVSGAAYTVSSGLHFAAAAMAGSAAGGGGGRGASRPSGGGRAPVATFGGVSSGGGGDAGGTVSITQVFSGATIVGPGGAREAARSVAGMVRSESRRGSRSAEFMAGG